MKLLDINNVDIDYQKIGEINRVRNALYRKIVYDIENNNLDLFAIYLKKVQTLQEIMSMKSAQQEATTKEESEQYLKNLRIALKYVIGKVSDDYSFSDHQEIIYLHSLIDPEGHAKHRSQYRNTLVKVGGHLAPEAGRIYSLMDNLMYQLNNIKAPIVKAIYAHHELVRVHPFVDGNGRVARLIMNWILMYDLYPPIFIKTWECRKRYIEDLDESFSSLEVDPFKPNKATDRFFADEIQRVYKSVQILAETLGKKV